ncbi:tyrosine-type recombinase/integrase [Agrobacterium sp. NPDC090273]|uniref:tyrosine-type recombinase/integrase n=1 Tax=Agrobacterium sp. NPDC090273 TaxID=3363919 RepID=UPI00383A18BA
MARQRGNFWLADVRTPDGGRIRKSFKTRDAAEEWEGKAREAALMGKPLPPVFVTEKARTTTDLNLLGNLYNHVCRTEWGSSRSGVGLKRNGKHVVEYFGKNKDISEITPAEAAEMKVHFSEKGLAPATVNRKLAALSKMLRVAKDNGLVVTLPRLRWNKVEQTKFRYLDDKEEKALLAYWEVRGFHDLHDLTVLLIDTGASCFSEMIPVKWDAFGPGMKTVTFWHTKTGKPRTVPLTKRCQAILKQRRSVQSKGPFDGFEDGAMRSRWDVMRADLCMADVTPHTLRHTCCTRLVLGGVDVKRVMEWMGHSAIVTTMRYMQIKPTSLEEIVHVLEAQ